MKKALLILLMFTTLTSLAQSIILTEDTILQGNQNVLFVRANGHDLTVNGNLTTTSFILVGSGTITVNGNLVVGTNLFFQSDNGHVIATGSVNVGTDVKGIGTITFCTSFNSLLLDDSVVLIQDCTLSITDFVQTINKGEPYIIYNSLGQMLRAGLYESEKDIYATELRVMRFPRLNYSSKMKLKIN